MQRSTTFLSCDRCYANMTINHVSREQLELKSTSEETGEEAMKKVDLCRDCYNDLVKFFGVSNPNTGMKYDIMN